MDDSLKKGLSLVDRIIEIAGKTENKDKQKALVNDCQELIDGLRENYGDENKELIDEAQQKLDKFTKKMEKENKGFLGFIKGHKKLLAAALAGMVLIGGCNALTHKPEDTKEVTTLTNEDEKEYDESLYSRNPLSGETLVSEGTAFVESLAKNGAYDKEGYGNDIYALLAVLNTNGAMPGKDEFIKNIDLEKYYAQKGDLNKGINQIDELIEKVVRARGDMDWATIVPHKKSASMLEKAETLYNKAGANPTAAQKEEWNKFINNEVVADLEQYSPFTIMTLQHYITMATDSRLMTAEQRDLFYKDLNTLCNSNGKNTCGVEATVGAEDTIYSSSKQIAVSYLESLLDDEKEHSHVDNETYYSFNEVVSKIKVNVKDIKNADINVEEKGREESIKNIDAVTSEKYPGITVDESDPKINHQNNTYQSGKHNGGEQVGDTQRGPNLDANGNETSQTKEEAINYSDIATKDFNNNQSKNEKLYKEQPAYKATWDALKKAFDEYSIPAPSDDNVVKEETEEEVIYYEETSEKEDKKEETSKNEDKKEETSKNEDKKEETSKNEDKKEETSKNEDKKEETSKNEDKKEETSKNEEVKEEEEIIIYDDYFLASDGNYYLRGDELPEGVYEVQYELETETKGKSR